MNSDVHFPVIFLLHFFIKVNKTIMMISALEDEKLTLWQDVEQ